MGQVGKLADDTDVKAAVVEVMAVDEVQVTDALSVEVNETKVTE